MYNAGEIDFVYTWVDGEDKTRLDYMEYYFKRYKARTMGCANLNRFKDNGELKYSLRSVSECAPWVNHIYIVTSFGQRPKWLNEDHPKVTVVDDWDILDATPVFNSHAIEACVNRIDGLSEKFVLFCDDYYINEFVGPDVFFDFNGNPNVYLRNEVAPYGKPEFDDGYRCGIKNANNILNQSFGFKERPFTKHVAYPLTKSLYDQVFQMWESKLCHTTRSRFRGLHDVCVHSQLIPHYALETAQATEYQIEVCSKDKFCAGKRDFTLGHVNNGTTEEIVGIYEELFPNKSQFEK